MLKKAPVTSEFYDRFDRAFVPSGPAENRIRTEFQKLGNDLEAIGLTHFIYRAVNVNKKGSDVNVLDLMFAPRAWVDEYYKRDWAPMTNAICHSKPPYRLNFFAKSSIVFSPKYFKFAQLGTKYGMFYDFLIHFRENPMSGGGFSGGRSGEKLQKSVLRQAFTLGTEFHWRLRDALGEIAVEMRGLTDTELRYLQLMFYGMSQKEIAETSSVSRNWVAKVCMSVRRKLGADTDAAAVATALALKILR